MNTITVDFMSETGKIKPMHAVNNGPVYKFTLDQRITNIDAFTDAGIPYARTHDASIYYNYGGEHTVDVHAIFPNFEKDPTDPASYDFVLTDEYLKVMDFAGIKPFYRLGSKIEHWPKKYGTLPPAVTYPITDWVDNFLAFLKDNNTPLDFFSWHIYSSDPHYILDLEVQTRNKLQQYW